MKRRRVKKEIGKEEEGQIAVRKRRGNDEGGAGNGRERK